MTDPIGDMLTRIRNASAVNKSDVTMPMSKLKFRVAETLEREGWIQKAEVVKASKDESKSSFDRISMIDRAFDVNCNVSLCVVFTRVKRGNGTLICF